MRKDVFPLITTYLQSWLPFRIEAERIPGLIVTIFYKGSNIFQESYGVADTKTNEMLTINHRFRMASQSKTVTAVSLFQLQEKGAIKIDDSVVKYLPWLADHHDSRWKEVTIRMILSHSAGIIRDGIDSNYWHGSRPFPDTEELKKVVMEQDLVKDPNTTMKYSNYGFGLLGMIIEQITQQSYESYCKAYIFDPIKADSMTMDDTHGDMSSIAPGYSRTHGHYCRRQFDTSVSSGALAPAAGLISTASDVAHFFHALAIGNETLLTDASKKEMQRAQWDVPNDQEQTKYALGLEVFSVEGSRAFGHAGGYTGHATNTTVFPDEELVISVQTNVIDGGATQLVESIFSIIRFFNEHGVPPQKYQPLIPYCGRYIDQWSISDFVIAGEKIVCVYPGKRPFSDCEELEMIDNNTLRVQKTNGFYAPGEQVTLHSSDDGSVSHITFAGSTMVPEAEWWKRYSLDETLS